MKKSYLVAMTLALTVASSAFADAGAAAKLEAKVRSGGAGSFGKVPMPATPAKVSDDSIKTIVSWALKQK